MSLSSGRMDRETSLVDRVVILERQVGMFDRLVHMLTSKLENQQKRYDDIVVAQQQQISDLNTVISTLVNEHHSHAEVLREKLLGALHGVSSTAASVSGTIRYSSSRGLEPENFFGEMLNNENNGKQDGGGRGPYDQHFDTNANNEAGGEPHGNSGKTSVNDNPAVVSGPDERQFSQSLIGYEEFSQLNNPRTHERSLYHDQGNQVAPVVSSERHQQPPDPNTEIDSGLPDEQYLNIAGRKRKRSIFMGNFQFLKSPHSVMEVWQEYTEGINGQPSIKEMESLYQTGWRRDPAVNKRYSRRRVLCKAIETGLNKGYSLQDTVNLLEECRIIDREKGLKQPIGWLCQGHSIPDALR